MNKPLKSIIQLLTISLFILSFHACSVKIPVATPKTSQEAYPQTSNNNLSMKFENHLPKNHKIAFGNDIYVLEHNEKPIQADKFIKSALKNELKARNIPLKFQSSSSNTLTLNDFSIMSRRVSGYSPLVTISTLKIKIKTPSGTKTLASMIKRAKTPIFSMGEVNEPCYNEPVTLLVKEIAAKINKNYFKSKFTNEHVVELEKKISENINEKATYLDVYELGFSNNLTSTDFLKKLTSDSHEYIRLAAISSLGTLQDTKQFDFLVSLYKKSKMWQDRAMTLKSIGDLNTKQSQDYLIQVKNSLKERGGEETQWTLRVINLYLK